MPRTDLQQGWDVSHRMIEAFVSGDSMGVTISVGVAQTGLDEVKNSEVLIKRADAQMCRAKAKSRKKSGHYVEPATASGPELKRAPKGGYPKAV
jgi:PleD family two-component response regulator